MALTPMSANLRALKTLAFIVSTFAWLTQFSFATAVGLTDLGMQGIALVSEGAIIIYSIVCSLFGDKNKYLAMVLATALLILFVLNFYIVITMEVPMLSVEKVAIFLPLLFPVIVTAACLFNPRKRAFPG